MLFVTLLDKALKGMMGYAPNLRLFENEIGLVGDSLDELKMDLDKGLKASIKTQLIVYNSSTRRGKC